MNSEQRRERTHQYPQLHITPPKSGLKCQLFIAFLTPIHALSASMFRLKNRENCRFPEGGLVRNHPPRGVIGEGGEIFFFRNLIYPGGKSKKPCFKAENAMGGGADDTMGGKGQRRRYVANLDRPTSPPPVSALTFGRTLSNSNNAPSYADEHLGDQDLHERSQRINKLI